MIANYNNCQNNKIYTNFISIKKKKRDWTTVVLIAVVVLGMHLETVQTASLGG